ncbi:hypothetical protein ATI61_107349 [Archangium gephyra]|uniref:Tetratricopeptide repeat protein n=1 Tax=Archangium gephyra TaxID=48 RepID=A0AAC8TJH0_9BACT|nr:hypothetical protein [Archangium gephyra]AKJ07905.1 Hypothetical protein AA314_09531 [Archangium gephyra]REG29653.1 hypothetical protein ATI61_107349 [Archangium gephyra]
MLPLTFPVLAAASSLVVAQAPAPGAAQADLARARELAGALRYEEAVVEYQRYLGHPDRPAAERAQALLELGFIHLLLEDTVNAEQRTTEALELDAWVRPPPNAPQKQKDLLERVRAMLAARPKLEVLPREDAGRPQLVRASLKDPRARANEVLLRHAPVPGGPYRATPMVCQEDTCEGELPVPPRATSFTAWYFVEALDAQGNTVARAANPLAPLQLSVIEQKAWYESPWIYAGGAALVVGAATVFFIASDPRK